MNRANKLGQGNNRGSLNPPIFFGNIAPYSIYSNHIWINTEKDIVYRHDGSNWVSLNGPRYIKKTSDTNINNTTTLSDVNGLEFVLYGNSGVFAMDLYIYAHNSSSADPDVKIAWDTSSSDFTQVAYRSCFGGEAQAYTATSYTAPRNSVHQISNSVVYAIAAGGTWTILREHCIFEAGTTNVTFNVQAAQNSAHASNTVITSHSHILLTKIA